MKGKIFSIEEFSTFDGPGIRMSVFLKGCPLRCSWCHNPEGQRGQTEYIRKNGPCLRCGACLRAGGGQLTQQSVRACPQGLIRRCGEDMEAAVLCERVLKNARVLAMNGGGVTFSGGEPLSQAAFVGECLSILHPRVHCALQTCGYAEPDVFGQILANVDYVLYDLKLMDTGAHRAFCGTDNALIHENYRTLCTDGVPFVTRIPLIPGVTDTAENVTAMAELMASLGVQYAELLPYNKMAGGKYGGLGRVYAPGFDESMAPRTQADIFARYGIEIRQL